ncbi:MAG TPA: hypothetical protein VIQ81_04190 [Gammaproteobacteria bacterium]
MHRVDNATSAITRPVPQVVGPNPNGYYQNNTVVDADWLNAVQEEIVGVILAAGMSLSKSYVTQLNEAIDVKIEDGIQSVLETNTRALFVQAAAPTGWTQDNSYNDRVIRVVNTANGGNTGGSWTISGLSVNGHQLSVNEMPSHNHGVTDPSHRHQFQTGSGGTSGSAGGVGGDINVTSDYATTGISIQNRGGNLAHSHGLTANGAWRPAYVDVIACVRN